MNPDLQRYSRHMVLPAMDVAGQQTLLDSHVLIIGAGGLGCAAAQYLAAAGVGTISIA
ncbi:MAG: ThiF family adenylyltransferase, partial [Nevskiales bacterium]